MPALPSSRSCPPSRGCRRATRPRCHSRSWPRLQPAMAAHEALEAPEVQEVALPSKDVELGAGVVVPIGELLCLLTRPLGMGSFGVVWAAHCHGYGEVAIKEIRCTTRVELSRAIYEAQLLWMLGGGGNEHAAPTSHGGSAEPQGLRIPAYVTCDVVEAPEGTSCKVRFAMSRIPGEPLDKFLHGQSSRVMDAGAMTPTSEVVDMACRFSLALLEQLVPTLEKVAAFAYHRDVNAHNILVNLCADGAGGAPVQPSYGLVDFGLATEARLWRDPPRSPPADVGPAEKAEPCSQWQYLDVGGDCRYWPTSAWMQFEVGWEGLATKGPLCSEYQTHLDFQGLGITALQTFIEMLPTSPSILTALGLVRLRSAWEEYWEAATRYWTDLLNTFRNNGDWDTLKREFVAMGVHLDIASKLGAMRAELDRCTVLCMHAPLESGLRWIPTLFSALLVLISAGEERPGPTTWEQVRYCLERCTPEQPRSQLPAPRVRRCGSGSIVLRPGRDDARRSGPQREQPPNLSQVPIRRLGSADTPNTCDRRSAGPEGAAPNGTDAGPQQEQLPHSSPAQASGCPVPPNTPCSLPAGREPLQSSGPVRAACVQVDPVTPNARVRTSSGTRARIAPASCGAEAWPQPPEHFRISDSSSEAPSDSPPDPSLVLRDEGAAAATARRQRIDSLARRLSGLRHDMGKWAPQDADRARRLEALGVVLTR